MKRKLSKIIIAMSAACYLFSSVTAYAAWTSSGQTDNYVSMGSYKTSIVEEYTQPQHVDPSETVDKIVNVTVVLLVLLYVWLLRKRLGIWMRMVILLPMKHLIRK